MSFFKSLFNKSVSTLQSNPVNQAINQTLNNVQNNLRETVKEIEETVKETPLIPKDLNLESFRLNFSSGQIPPTYYNQQVDFNSGVVLAQLYQADITLLKQNNSKLVRQSDLTDAKVVQAVQVAQFQAESFNKFARELESSLPEFTSTVNRMNKDIDFLCCRIEKLENVLTQQLDDCTIQRIQNFDQQQSQDTAKLRAKKQAEFAAAEQQLKNDVLRREKMAMEVEKMKIQHSIQQMKLEAQAKERADRIREQEIQLEREKHQVLLRQSLSTPPSTPQSTPSTPLTASQTTAVVETLPLKLEEESPINENATLEEESIKVEETKEESKESVVVSTPVEVAPEEEKPIESKDEKVQTEVKAEEKTEETEKEAPVAEEKETEGEEDEEGEDVSGWL